MTNFKDIYKGNLDWLEKGTIFVTLHGSQSYGTNTPTSDVDMKGICIPPKEYYYGFTKVFEQAEQSEPIDLVIYSLKKFMKLAADCNPNIIEVLFTDPSKWVLTTPVFDKLYKHRHEFISMKAKHTFSGYAISQLKRIKSHRNWLLNPVTRKPTRKDFGLSEAHKINASIRGAFENLENRHNLTFDSKVMQLLDAEKRYAQSLQNYNQYQNWKNNRNTKRAELEIKVGYDAKHAMHLVRLMRMCKEIITKGEVVVTRPDAADLLEIRNGAWSYDKLINWAEEMDSELELLYKKQSSVIPHAPNKKLLDQLCIELTEEHLNDRT